MSRRGEQKAMEPVISRAREQAFPVEEKSRRFARNAKICFGCIAFWSIEPTVGVEIGISASAVMDFFFCVIVECEGVCRGAHAV